MEELDLVEDEDQITHEAGSGSVGFVCLELGFTIFIDQDLGFGV